MITAIDTHVFVDILLRDAGYFESSRTALSVASSAGALVICDVVYAELSAQFASRRECDRFMERLELRVEGLSREASYRAGQSWWNYRRRGGARSRIISDFMIGAHALLQADRLLTRDRGFYRDLFSGLKIYYPGGAD